MIKKVLYSIFICLASFFLMSHNASASPINSNVSLINGNFRSQLMTQNWNDYNGNCAPSAGSWVDQISCDGGAGLRLYNLYVSIPNLDYKAGDWVVITLNYRSGYSNTSNHFLQDAISYGGSHPIELVYSEYQMLNANSSQLKIFMRAYGSFKDSNLKFVGSNGSYGLIDIVGSQDSSPSVLRPFPTSVWRETSEPNYSNSINSINDTLKQQQQQEAQDRQDTNTAIDDSKNTSNSSSSDVQNNSSTQSLLSVITGFFGAITSASPSSCVLSGQINEYLTPSFDLCQLDPPPALTALLSIPVAIALFFFAKHMLNKIIALIRSFQ